MCGENAFQLERCIRGRGSSPRVRGKRFARRLVRGLRRLIPACAGKTFPRGKQIRQTGAHPRVCGENPSWAAFVVVLGGSSPRVRGKRTDRSIREAEGGLIPACAGKTSLPRQVRHPVGAHPRVCGENFRRLLISLCRMGSSPRVRGKHALCILFPGLTGLIPACAGKTANFNVFGLHFRAHPRVCGENGKYAGSPVLKSGSSPRVRGKPNRWKAKAA